MTAVAIAPTGTAEVLQWLAPAPLWDGLTVGAGASGLAAPWIAELGTDTFMKDFLGVLAGTDGASPADLATMAPDTTVGDVAGAPYRLFQPLSQRYYLVSAELVCRRPGIPDHTVSPALKERASFVMRRLTATGDEEGFVPGPGKTGSWLAAGGDVLLPGEKDYPMHPAPVTPYALPGSTTSTLGLDKDTGSGRTVLVGYVPVAMGESLRQPMADPAKAFADLTATTPPPGGWPDPVLSWLYTRVLQPWNTYAANKPSNIAYCSLFLLLDLGDWLNQQLNPVYQAIISGASLTGAYGDLLDGLDGQTITRGGSISLRQGIAETIAFNGLLTGADIPGPGVNYDAISSYSSGAPWLATQTTSGSLAQLAQAALAVNPVPAVLPPELEGMFLETPTPPAGSPDGAGTTYVIRTVFSKGPGQPQPCQVLSAPTHPFELARALDADAPARKILLQMPDITNMRKFKKGVAVEMPPALAKMIDRVTPDMLKGDPPGSSSLTLGWICSFSLQIIFLVAFIVMFIFLLLLNIVFFWMPFLKICFPIPVPASSQKAPTP